jgi:hypothetical protein
VSRLPVVFSSIADLLFTDLLLLQRLDQPPTTELLERFLVTITKNAVAAGISKRRDSGVSSVGWLQRGLHSVIVGLRFRYLDWKPQSNAGYRFRSLINTLLEKGQLTRDPVRIKQWITTRLCYQLATAYLSQCLNEDVKSWDVVFMRTITWLLQSAVDGHAGDVVMTKGYDPTKHTLFWDDLTIKTLTEKLEDVIIKVALRNSKVRGQSYIRSI